MGRHFATLTKPIRKRNGRRDLCPGSLSSFVVPSNKRGSWLSSKKREEKRDSQNYQNQENYPAASKKNVDQKNKTGRRCIVAYLNIQSVECVSKTSLLSALRLLMSRNSRIGLNEISERR
jgi:hypothetical protein